MKDSSLTLNNIKSLTFGLSALRNTTKKNYLCNKDINKYVHI